MSFNRGWCKTSAEAYAAGRQTMLEWEGPNGDGTLGNSSSDFLAEKAQESGFPSAWWDGWEGKPFN